jgi:hypothetical protein
MKSLVLLSLLLAATVSFAADWSKMRGVPGNDQHFFDRSKLVVSGSEITYWRKIVFQSPQSVPSGLAASGLLRERIHCSEHTLKLISYLYYAMDGSVVEYVDNLEKEASPIIPDTLGDLLEKNMCPLVWQKQKENPRNPAETSKSPPAEKSGSSSAPTSPDTPPEEKK